MNKLDFLRALHQRSAKIYDYIGTTNWASRYTPATEGGTGGASAEWCVSNTDVRDICDGTADDCLAAGVTLCDARADCFGVMYHPRSWSNSQKGVKLCLSPDLGPKTDWYTIMKNPGTFIVTRFLRTESGVRKVNQSSQAEPRS